MRTQITLWHLLISHTPFQTEVLTRFPQVNTLEKKQERNAGQHAAADWTDYAKCSADSNTQLGAFMSQLNTSLSRLQQLSQCW